MENNLPNDALEEFLKKSFEDYQESPSDDLWSNIESSLPASAGNKPVSFRRYWLAAAASVLIGIVAAQHFYYNQKIKELSAAVGQSRQEEARQAENSATTQLELPQAPGEQPAAAAEMPSSPQPRKAGPFQSALTSTKPALQSNKRLVPPVMNGGTANLGPAGNLAAGVPSYPMLTNEKNPVSPASAAEGQTGALNSTTEAPEALAGTTVAAPAKVRNLDLRLLPETAISAPALSSEMTLEIHPLRSSLFSLGIHQQTMAVRETLKRFYPERIPNRPGRPERFVNTNMAATGLALVRGVTASCELTDKLSIVSGLDYRQTSLSSVHQPSFKFKERIKWHGGGGPQGDEDHEHDFTYNLNTSAGLVEVDLRVAEADTTLPVSEDDVVAFEVETRNTMRHLSLPLVLKYQIGSGRLRGYAKAGAVVNWLLKDQIEITSLSTANENFNISMKRPSLDKTQGLRTVTANYFLSAGVEYALSSSLSCYLEPVAMGNLGSQHSADFIKSSSMMAGLNAGIEYRF
ncbi:MAG: hypothetical protein RI973_1511 [Bacteroidota bacterium]|jgi:hypothetical protein